MQDLVENNATVSKEVKKVISIDFNCDLAQSYGIYKNEKEFELLDYVTSVNIATGFHAGDPLSIKEALLKAKEKNVAIGAHIGYQDIQGNGMRPLELSEDETEALVIYQVGALMSFAKAFSLEIEYVKPHGAMYQRASQDFQFSCTVAKAIKKCSQWLTYTCAAGDIITKVGDFVQLPISQEIDLSRVYNINGSIDFKSGRILDTEKLTRRLQRYLQYSQIDNVAGGTSFICADTMHFSNETIELLKKANELISPKPVNYSKVESSGWV